MKLVRFVLWTLLLIALACFEAMAGDGDGDGVDGGQVERQKEGGGGEGEVKARTEAGVDGTDAGAGTVNVVDKANPAEAEKPAKVEEKKEEKHEVIPVVNGIPHMKGCVLEKGVLRSPTLSTRGLQKSFKNLV